MSVRAAVVGALSGSLVCWVLIVALLSDQVGTVGVALAVLTMAGSLVAVGVYAVRAAQHRWCAHAPEHIICEYLTDSTRPDVQVHLKQCDRCGRVL